MSTLWNWWRAVGQQWTGKNNYGDNDDPEMLLFRAQKEMNEMHARNRERAVRAITQKNQLEQMVQEAERRVESLQREIREAEAQGDHEAALRISRDSERFEVVLDLTKVQHQQATETVEQIKAAIKSEEERLQGKTAHAMALIAQWKLVRIEQAITLSLTQISMSGSGGGAAAHLTHEQVQERHERNREYLAEAFTQKNSLAQMVGEIESKIAVLHQRADTARTNDEDELEHQLLRQMEQYEATLVQMREALQQAVSVAERARDLVQDEAVRVRALVDSLPPPAQRTETETLLAARRIIDAADEDSDSSLRVLMWFVVAVLALCAGFVWWLVSVSGGG